MLGCKVTYVNCSYNKVAKGIRLLEKKRIFCLCRKKFMQVRAFERYIPLWKKTIEIYELGCKGTYMTGLYVFIECA